VRTSTALRLLGFWLTAAVMVFAFAFVIGETVSDPGGWAAVGYLATWLVPLAALVWLAIRRPEWASRLLLAALVLPVGFAAWGLLDRQGWRDFQDGVGPVGAILVMVLGTALAFLGRHRTHMVLAGWAMVALTVLPALLLAGEHGGAMSTLLPSVPVLVSGLLYVVAGHAARDDATVAEPRTSPRHLVRH